MQGFKVSEDLRPLTDLKSASGEIVNQVEKTGRPVVLTRHGRGVAVLLSLESFEALQEGANERALLHALSEAEVDVREGRTLSHAELKARFLGSP